MCESSFVLCLLLVVVTAYPCSSRAQFNLFPNTWNTGTLDQRQQQQPRRGESHARPDSGCSTLLDINTHGSQDCPRDFFHQYFDTHLCRFLCLSDVNGRSTLFDQNDVARGDKPRQGLP